VSAAIVADKAENGKKLFAKVLFAWENFSEALKEYLDIREVNKSGSELALSNGSSIIVGTTIHSGTHQILHLSELGPLCEESMEKAAQVVQSAMPTIPDETNTFVFIESTARKEGDLFHARCIDAQAATKRAELANPENPRKALSLMEYRFFFFPWWQAPKYKLKTKEEAQLVQISREDQFYFDRLEEKIGRKLSILRRAWYVLKRQAIKTEAGDGGSKMRAEYPSYAEEAFLSSGDKLYDQDIIQLKINTDVRAPIEEINDHKVSGGKWLIYKRYNPKHVYALAGDPAKGFGGHHSAAVIEDFTTNEIVATYKSNHIDPMDFGRELARAGRWYGTCLIAPEINFGTSCVAGILEDYPEDRVYHFHIMTGDDPKETERIGWLTTTHSKDLMMRRLRDDLQDEDAPLLCPDSAILYEALYFDKKDVLTIDTAQSHKMTKHFDLLTAAAIANMMRGFAVNGEEEQEEEMKQIIQDRRRRKKGYG